MNTTTDTDNVIATLKVTITGSKGFLMTFEREMTDVELEQFYRQLANGEDITVKPPLK